MNIRGSLVIWADLHLEFYAFIQLFALEITVSLWKSAAPYGIVICEILNEFADRAFSNNITIPG